MATPPMMEKKKIYIELDVIPKNKNIGVIKQFNINTIELVIKMKDGPDQYSLENVTSGRISIKRPDGTVSNSVVEIDTDLIYYTMEQNAVSLIGVYEAEIQLHDVNNAMLVSSSFFYTITEALFNSEDITPQPEYPVLVQLISEVDGLKTSITADEALRDTAEVTRVNAEIDRGLAENTRANAEMVRVSNENARIASEANRVSAETARAAAYSSFQSDEQAWTEAERDRGDNEVIRLSNEAQRQANEAIRIANENDRLSYAYVQEEEFYDLVGDVHKYAYGHNPQLQVYTTTGTASELVVTLAENIYSPANGFHAYVIPHIDAGPTFTLKVGALSPKPGKYFRTIYGTRLKAGKLYEVWYTGTNMEFKEVADMLDVRSMVITESRARSIFFSGLEQSVVKSGYVAGHGHRVEEYFISLFLGGGVYENALFKKVTYSNGDDKYATDPPWTKKRVDYYWSLEDGNIAQEPTITENYDVVRETDGTIRSEILITGGGGEPS